MAISYKFFKRGNFDLCYTKSNIPQLLEKSYESLKISDSMSF